MSGATPIDGGSRLPITTTRPPASTPVSREVQERLMLARLFGQNPATESARTNPLQKPAIDDTAPHLGRHLDVTA
jgi:hypothetical protein